MSKLSIKPDLFLESQELNRWQDFIFDQGFVKALLQNSMSFGIVNRNIDDGLWNDFKVEQGSVIGSIKINTGVAIDVNGKFITWSENEIPLANDNVWKWIKIKHFYDVREAYTVEVDKNGNLLATGGDLLSVLRGTNIAVRIMFENATLNTQEYEVVEVIDSEHAVLAGNFVAESGLRMAVVGAFTPGTVTPTESKFPYRYDGVTITAVTELTLNTPPTLVTGQEFLIARIKRNGSSILIEDKRALSIYRSKADHDTNTVDLSINPLIGVEKITYDNKRSTRTRNIASIGFGFRSTNWTFNSSINTVTILGGNGGIYHDTSFFSDGDFDGWRVYFKSGRYAVVRQSSIAALQINLVLSDLNPDELADTSQQIAVVPNADSIEVVAKTPDSESKITETRFTFPINEGEVKIALPVYKASSCQYVMTYRYKSLKTFSQETMFPDDVVGYLREGAFNSDGGQINNSRLPYSSGIITLVDNPQSYQNIIDTVVTGQILGVEYVAIDTNVNPVIPFIVGERKEVTIITNDDDLDTSDADYGPEYVLTADVYLDLRTDGEAGLKNGNSFIINFRGDYDPNGFSINLVQDYVNSGDPGIPLASLTPNDYFQASIGNLGFICRWDGERWVVDKVKYVREGGILTDSLADGVVTGVKIADGTITSGKLATTSLDLMINRSRIAAAEDGSVIRQSGFSISTSGANLAEVTVTHNIGNTNYTVQVTPITATTSDGIGISDVQNNTFKIISLTGAGRAECFLTIFKY